MVLLQYMVGDGEDTHITSVVPFGDVHLHFHEMKVFLVMEQLKYPIVRAAKK
jgi:hypothetical protein